MEEAEPTDAVHEAACLPVTPKILIVDDDPSVSRLMAAWLTFESYDSALCGTGQEAVDPIAHGWRPRVIVMDVMLPVLDGTTAIKKLKDNPATATIPIVAISAGMTLKQQTAERTLADALLPKPFDMEALSLAAEHWVRKGAP